MSRSILGRSIVAVGAMVMVLGGLAQAGTFVVNNFADGSDAATGISSDTTYTHLVDINKDGDTADINGVLFGNTLANYTLTGAGTPYAGWTPGASVTGTGITHLLNNFQYNGKPAVLTVSGLTPGTQYRLRIYVAGWQGTFVSFSFDDTAPATVASGLDRGAGQDIPSSFDYSYTLSPGDTDLTVTISPDNGSDTMHLFGFSNEALAPESSIVFSDLAVSNITTTTASLYATVNTNLTSATVVWDTEDKGHTNLQVWAGSGSATGTTPGLISGSATGLLADTAYVFRFHGEDATTNGWSAIGSFATDLTAAQTPEFTNAVASSDSVTLQWDDNADTESGYVLQRSTNGVDFAVVAELEADTTSHTDDGLLTETTYYYQLAATNDLNESGTAFSACATNTTTLFMPAVTTYSGSTGSWDKDTWNNAANWNAGIPSASQDAIIAEAEYVSVYQRSDTPAYTGSLTLSSNAMLEVGQSAVPEDLNVLGGSNIYFNTGSELRLRYNNGSGSTHSQNFVMLGDAKFTLGTSSSAHHDSRTLTGSISGPGKLTAHVSHNNTLYLQGNSPGWSGGIYAGGSEDESKSSRIEAESANALGTGDIAMDDGMGLQIDAADAMGDGATLNLTGGDGSLSHKLVMNADDTIDSLNVNGYAFPAGTHGMVGTPATVDYEWAWIGGTSVLTVVNAPAAPAPPTVEAFSPTNGTVKAYAWQSLVATFDHEFIYRGTGNITIKDLTGGTQTVIPIDDPRISIVGMDLIINPTEPLPKGSDYAIQIDATALVDPWGQNFAGIADNTTWSFTVSGDLNAHLVAYWPLSDGTNGQLVSATGGADDVIDDPDHDATDATVSGDDLQTWVYDADPKRKRIVLSTVHGARLFAGYTEMNVDFTWSVWAKSADRVSTGCLLGTRDGTYARLYMNGCHSDGYGITFAFTTNSALDGAWHHIVLRREGNTFSGYVDGVFDSSITRAKGDNRMKFEIGGTSKYPGDFIGYMSDAAIWEEALTEERIAELAAGGPVIVPPPAGSVLIVR
jgi:hypothetical protein